MRRRRVAATALRSLLRFKLRSALMMIGTLIGIATLTFVLVVGRAAEAKLLTTVRQLFGSSSIVVSAGGGFFMGGPRESARLTLDDIEAVVQDVPGVALWDPLVLESEASVRRADRSASVRLMGLSERGERAWNRGAERGHFFDASDVSASARVALLGHTVARALFPGEDPLGQEIQVGSVPFRVVGILEGFGTDIHGMDRDNEIVVPVTTAMRRVLNVDSIRAAKLLLAPDVDIEGAAKSIADALRERHRLSAGAPDDFTVTSSVAIGQMVGRVERVLFLYLPLATGVVLLAAMAVAASLMLASVSERRSEIGLRCAVGARPRDISLQFLTETAATALGGGLSGLILGGILARAVAERAGLEVGLGPGLVALGLLVSVLTGLVAGVAPARRASRLRPADALR